MIFPFLPQPLDMVVKSGLVSIRFGREPGIKIGDTFLEVDSSILRSVLDKIDGINATSWDNGNGGTKSINLNDPDIVRSLFRRIHLIPTSWHYSGKRINYRRFFAVNGLISIRSEDIETLIRTHRKIIDLAMSLSTIEGLRIDHIDGLFDPARYVRMMRENLPGRVLMAEKILMPGEILDSSLGLDGTTGYDFLSALDLLFLYPPGLEKLREVFNEINRGYESQGYVLERYKIEFLEKEYSGDLDHLAWLFYDSLVADHGMELTFHETRETVKRVLMSLNRYRTYASYDRIEPLLEWLDNFNMEQGCTITRIISTHLHNECLVCLKPMLKLQQYTGAIMAKNLEDRLFFSYNPLIFLNEVGHAPWEKPFTPEAFFDFVEKRKLCRYSFNETSTHDTKYGEDLRYVGIAISQFPVQYEEALDEIQRSITVKESAKKIRGEHLVYLIQLIIASYGVRNYYPDYTSAVKGQLIKAARESALETDWKNVNEKYERLVLETFDKIISEIDSKRLMKTDLLIDLCRSAGEYDSISSLILKFILPGISACYQGSEFGNYHFTDPDNRALVDFAAIHANLREFSGMRKFRDYPAGFRGYKLALFSFLASLRSKHLNLIQEGKIASLSVSGDHRDAVIAYTVSLNHEVLVIALVRYTSAFFGTGLVFRA
ncbi:MAG TPA: hypothetical protein VKU79_06650, partial [Thermoplasmataceae archaeon]|nr:hypothetical protein [Thermoplasmataceae archaeon]